VALKVTSTGAPRWRDTSSAQDLTLCKTNLSTVSWVRVRSGALGVGIGVVVGKGVSWTTGTDVGISLPLQATKTLINAAPATTVINLEEAIMLCSQGWGLLVLFLKAVNQVSWRYTANTEESAMMRPRTTPKPAHKIFLYLFMNCVTSS
jgi:hypothetical protein